MRTRHFGRLKAPVSELGYGMWGLAGWKGHDDTEVQRALDLAVKSGVTFFDTALAYGEGRSERILGDLIRRHPEATLFTATKIAPKNRTWPSRRGMALRDVFPADYILSSTEVSLANLGLSRIDLMQFHVWEDEWADDLEWQDAVRALKTEGLIGAIGISINRWEPWNALKTLRTGLIDCVQVIYNIFDQAPEDGLFPLCRELGIAVIARVPFDEGSLTGELRRDSVFPEKDYRRMYFSPENLGPTMDRVDALVADLPVGMPLAETAIRFILSHPDVTTVIPGMRRTTSVLKNVAAAEAGPLSRADIDRMRAHRWDRVPKPWSA